MPTSSASLSQYFYRFEQPQDVYFMKSAFQCLLINTSSPDFF